jgi:hypothetical protein
METRCRSRWTLKAPNEPLVQVLSFMMPHEALWVEELLARPRRRHLCHPAPPQPALPLHLTPL